MMKRPIIVCIFVVLLSMIFAPVNANAPIVPRHITPTVSVQVVTPLIVKLLSTSIVGCSQSANVNATWIGDSYYIVNPSSFVLILRTPNAIYGNNTDLAFPNEANQWYLFHNIPITIKVSFQFCGTPSQETLVYTDGTYLFVLT